MDVSVTFALEAQQHLERGDAATAAALCQQGIALYPQYATAYLILARALLAQGEYAAADRAIQEGMQSVPRLRTMSHGFGGRRAAAKPAKAKSPNATPPLEIPNTVSEELSAAAEAALSFSEHPSALPEQPLGVPESATPLERHVAEVYAQAEYAHVKDSHVEAQKEHMQTENPSQSIVTAVKPSAAAFSAPQMNAPQRITLPTEQDRSLRDGTPGTSNRVLPRTTPEDTEKTLGGYLRLVSRAHSEPDAQSSLRSNNIRLIPGLEFTSLRVEVGGGRAYQRGNQVLPDFPDASDGALPSFGQDFNSPTTFKAPQSRSVAPTDPPIRRVSPTDDASAEESLAASGFANDEITVELDDLARRLATVQMPSMQELMQRHGGNVDEQPDLTASTNHDIPHLSPALASETMAAIFEEQGAYTEALRAYQALLQTAQTLEKREHFERKIADVQRAMNT
jgi:tetratricopeptide (TPR) repeat protein